MHEKRNHAFFNDYPVAEHVERDMYDGCLVDIQRHHCFKIGSIAKAEGGQVSLIFVTVL